MSGVLTAPPIGHGRAGGWPVPIGPVDPDETCGQWAIATLLGISLVAACGLVGHGRAMTLGAIREVLVRELGVPVVVLAPPRTVREWSALYDQHGGVAGARAVVALQGRPGAPLAHAVVILGADVLDRAHGSVRRFDVALLGQALGVVFVAAG